MRGALDVNESDHTLGEGSDDADNDYKDKRQRITSA